MRCSSCKKEVTYDCVRLKCPRCGKSIIIRCMHCREVAAPYKCETCGFMGP